MLGRLSVRGTAQVKDGLLRRAHKTCTRFWNGAQRASEEGRVAERQIQSIWEAMRCMGTGVDGS
jgi:hypothetical protein